MTGPDLEFREATSADVPGMVRAREGDEPAGPADPRMALYLDGKHHPQKALASRIAYVAIASGSVVGYIGGHLTRRYACDGELQYLYVVPGHRRSGGATRLLRMLTHWFGEHAASRICVGVDEENVTARAFFSRYGAERLDLAFMVWPDIQQALGLP